MARNRMIKPDFWDDEKLSKISRDARLTFIGLWTHADDIGICKANFKWLLNKIYPYDSIKPETFGKWIDELINLRLIMLYEVNNESFLHIKSFLKHQTINKPTKSYNPIPSDLQLQEYYGSSVVVVKPKRKEIEVEKKENSSFVLPDKLNGIISSELWKEWEEYRIEIKKPLSETGIKKQVEFLLKQPDPAECINSAIRNHWQGLFEVKYNEQKKADLPKPPVLSYDEMFGMPGGTT
jgi:hypothetical protein